MPRPLRLSDDAKADMEDIWVWTAEKYDVEQADRYQKLLNQALDDIRIEPERPSSRERPELGKRVRSYAIDLSKERSGTGIKSPRHVVFYTLAYEDTVVVLRILHDRMEPGRYVADE